jgi:carotenoid 1,2-hydratase
VIAFVGSVFSPYYRRALRRAQGRHGGPDGGAEALDHCAINVALYSPGAARWTMTERGARHVQRSARSFVVGPSRLAWEHDGLTIDIDEIAVPLPRRVRGRIRVLPRGLSRCVAALDAAGRHRWGPIAPSARVEVEFERPGLRWQGQAYLDSNEGDEPVTAGFSHWDWLRAELPGGRTAVVYDAQGPSGHEPARVIAACFAPDGTAQPMPPPPRQALPGTLWGIERGMRGDAPATALRRLEDTPFYARAALRSRWLGHDATAMHETLDLRRFAAPWVQALLPFRMPRRA